MRFKDDHQLRRARLQPATVADPQTSFAASRALLAAWLEVGGLLRILGKKSGIAPECALAVWQVESGGLPFVPGRPVLRLECHKLWEEWGHREPERFDAHFQFGGRGGIAGVSWAGHRFRERGSEWRNFHGSQQLEYKAFALARRLAGIEAACRASSFGGPQIMGFNHEKLGYPNAAALYRAFARSLRAQVLGFFDFCQSENLNAALISSDWHAFARIYNGPGRTDAYAEWIDDAFRLATPIIAGDQAGLVAAEEMQDFDREGFAAFIATLGLKHFSAREFLFRGRANSAPSSPAYGLNRFPPRELWPNIAPVAKAVDAFRSEVGSPVTLFSIYRSPAYNAAMGGSPASRHTAFAAIDLQVKNGSAPVDWLDLLRRIRAQGVFTGAIGLHADALHIDARGENMDL